MLAFIITIGVWISAGWLIARYGIGVRDGVLLPPLSIGLGMWLHTWLLNVALRVLPVLTASWGVLAAMLLIGVGCVLARRGQHLPLDWAYNRRTLLALGLLWIATTGVVFQARQYYATVDEMDHGPRAILFRQSGIPTQLTGISHANPAYCAYYHYAENATEGAISRQTGILHLEQIADIRVALGTAAVLGLCLALLRRLFSTLSLSWHLVGTALFFFLGPGNWTALAGERLDHRYAQQVANAFRFQDNTYVPFVHAPDLMVPLSRYLETPNPLMFWIPAFIAWLGWLRYRQHSMASPWAWMSIATLTASSALYFETAMPLVAVSIGLDLIYRVWKDRSRSALTALLAYSIPAFTLMVIQGGTITDTLFCQPIGEIHAQARGVDADASLTSFHWKGNLSYSGGTSEAFGYAPIQLLNPSTWYFVLIDWGISLFIYPLVWLYTLSRNRLAGVILTVGGMLISFSFLFQNEISATNNYRFAVLPLWMGGALSISLLSSIWRIGWFHKSIILLLLTVSCTTGVINMAWAAFQPPNKSSVMSQIDYTVQAEWLGKLDPDRDSVFDPSLDIERTRGTARAIMVFGTPARHIIHVSLPNVLDYRTQIWRDNLFPGDLRTLGYTHLYIDQTFLENSNDYQLQRLHNTAFYQPIQEWREGGQLRRLYAIVGEERYQASQAVIGRETLGLTPEFFARYQAYQPAIPANAVIFNPKTDHLIDPYDDISRVSNIINREDVPLNPWFDLLAMLDAMRYQPSFSEDDQAHIQNWRATKTADSLQDAIITHILVDGNWLGWLSQEEQQQLNDPAQYEQVGQWLAPDGSFDYRVYQVIRDE